ncbi:NADH:flavin oxidoreductase [Aeromicrobium sp.]|uniref:NADH:flavin oxidoreductase n=1 Tax=Aeromicrobium sp. TaxID=1871063 RepID=UPI0035153CD0
MSQNQTTDASRSPADELSLRHGPAWRNRLALAPLTNTQSHADGTLSDDEHDWLVARGRGGFGMTMTCAAYVGPAAQAWGGQLGIATDEHLPGLERLAASLRATGTVSSVQLYHGGRRSDPALTGVDNVAPWSDPATRSVALTTEGVEEVVQQFVDAAVRAERAGFDGVQVHGAHGYLVGQFMDARKNDRTDRYGGSLENRMRMTLEILQGIRDATGPDFQLSLRLTPEGNGIQLEDGRAIAGEVLASGLLDHLDVSLWDVFMKPRGGADGLLIDHFVDLPRHGALLSVAGTVDSAADVQWCLDRGVDAVSVGIAAILHHDFAARAIADPEFTARPRPVAREVLRAEHVSPTFIDYLAAGWKDLVA